MYTPISSQINLSPSVLYQALGHFLNWQFSERCANLYLFRVFSNRQSIYLCIRIEFQPQLKKEPVSLPSRCALPVLHASMTFWCALMSIVPRPRPFKFNLNDSRCKLSPSDPSHSTYFQLVCSCFFSLSTETMSQLTCRNECWQSQKLLVCPLVSVAG